MCSQKMEAALVSTPFGQQRITRFTRRLLNSVFRLICRPHEDFVPDSPSQKPAVQKAGFRAALRSQPMIYSQRTDFSVPLTRPTIRKNGESKTVRTTGDCDGEKRAGFKASERGERGSELSRSKRF